MNKNYILLNTITIVAVIIFPLALQAEQTLKSPLGFEFGTDKDDAKKIINSNGVDIIHNSVDTKKIRLIKFPGVFAELPVQNAKELFTELEFFDDKLMSSAVLINSREAETDSKLLLDHLKESYGEPANSEQMLTYYIWTWEFEDTKMVFSKDSNSGSLKLNYIYKPINQKRIAREIHKKRKGDVQSPADEMFKEGNYSRPTGFPY